MYISSKQLARKLGIGKVNRFGSIADRSKCSTGHYHPSRLESGYCDILRALKEAGEIRDYRTQIPYELRVNEILVTRHIVDFEVVTNEGKIEGKIEVHETKGPETQIWLFKSRLFKGCYPDIPYHVVK